MTDKRIITLSPVEPAECSFRHAIGVPLDMTFAFTLLDKPVDLTGMNLQLTLAPRTRGIAYGYDMEIADAINGLASVEVPGNFFNDPNGFTLELYNRDSDGVPIALLAKGVVLNDGGAYTSKGPLGPMSVPVITVQGPAGPQGEPGERGSVWTTGTGTPAPTGGEIVGDMYLDEATGNVWRFDESGVWIMR